MGIIFFILIAGAWAAFLLPSFFDHRRDNPSETTRQFAVTKARLGALAGSDEPLAVEYHAARNAQVRRQRVFIALLVLALATLVVAVMTSSWIWLGATIVVDVAIGAYVALMLFMRQQSTHRQRTVVHMERTMPHPPTAAEDLDFDAAPPSVRIIGG
jgi:hypothetical protein